MRVPCLWSCGERVARGAMAEHQGSCAGAWLRCPGPGCGERMRRRYAGEHWARCPAMPDVCPECKVLVLRGEMSTHLDEQCEVARRLRKFTCPICLTEEDVDGAFTPDCDAHRFCFECVVGHVRSKVNAMSATSDERVTCPLCPVELSPHQVGGLQRPRLLGKSSHVYLVFEEVTSGSEWGGLLRSPTHSNASSPMHNGKFLFKNM